MEDGKPQQKTIQSFVVKIKIDSWNLGITIFLTGKVMTVKPDTEARSRKYCCRGKRVSILYSDFVFLALVIQHLKSMRLLHFQL